MTEAATKVVIAWVEKGQLDSVQTLSGYDGVRAFEKGKVDPRIIKFHGNPKYFGNFDRALVHMCSHPGTAVQIELSAFNKGTSIA